MDFREYYRLHEDKNYILMKNSSGQYKIIGPTRPEELPRAMQMAQHANNPKRMWTYNIASGGQLNLPPELEHDKENILHAHYARMGFDKKEAPAERPEEKQDFSDYIDPDVMNPDYEKSHELWKKYQSQQGFQQMQKPHLAQPGTIDYGGNPISSGAITPRPK